jgi:hypothetical protein
MENYNIVIFIPAIMIGLSAVAGKIRLSYPVLLIAAGIGIGFVPSMPVIELNPELVFLIFLPPLLYDAAFNISMTLVFIGHMLFTNKRFPQWSGFVTRSTLRRCSSASLRGTVREYPVPFFPCVLCVKLHLEYIASLRIRCAFV